MNKTSEKGYTKRLVLLQRRSWKTALDVQRPYRWNLRRLNPGRTLDIGCGIGRCLADLPAGSIGIDHNPHSIEFIKEAGLEGYTPAEFKASTQYHPGTFDSILFSHVLEHMTPVQSARILAEYAPLVRYGGAAIVMCPQEKGYSSDESHVTFLDAAAIARLLIEAGFKMERSYSFPFPRPIGRLFTYNEFVCLGRKTTTI